MAEAEATQSSPKSYDAFKQFVKADGRDLWEPEKYARLGVYVTIYDYVRQNLQDFAPMVIEGKMQPSKYKDPVTGNYIDFGIKSNSALSVEVNQMIRNNIDWFIEKLGINESVADGGVDINLNREQFLAEFDGYIQECNEIVSSAVSAGALPSHPKDADGNPEPLTSDELRVLLRAKEEKVRAWFDDIRNSVEGKPMDIDPKTGKPIGGFRTIAVTKVELERKELLAELATNSGNVLFKTLLTAGGAGLTIASGLTLISSGATALGSVLGTAFAAGPVGIALASAVGAVVGFKVTVKAFSSMITAIGTQAKLCKNYFEFMHGIGKYKPDENNIPKGYRAVKKDYEKARILKKLFTGFKTPKRAADFEAAFEKYFEDFLKENGHYFSKADLAFIRGKKSKVKFTLQVTDGEKFRTKSDGSITHCGASTFGRVRALANRHIAVNRTDYKLTNPNEVTRLVNQRIEACDNIEQLFEDLKYLEDVHGTFTNLGREHTYKEFEQKYAKKAVEAINNTAFNEPLTIDTVQDLIDALDNPKIGEIVKSGGFADKTKDYKSIQKYIEIENLDSSVSVNLSTSLNNQINISKASMLSAITSEGFELDRFEAGTPEYAEAEAVIDRIIAYNQIDQAEKEAIKAAIEALPSPLGHTHDYLKFMLDKKVDESTFKKDDIVNSAKAAATGGYSEPAFEFKDVIAYAEGFGKDGIRADTPSTKELYNRLTNIVNDITSTPLIDDAKYNAIKSEIQDAFNGRPKLEEYLIYVLDSKAGKISSSVEMFAEKITNLNYSDLRSDKPSQLMNLIMASNMPIKSKALTSIILENQLKALKARQNNECKVYMMEVLKKGSYDNFEEYANKILGLTKMEDLDSEETSKFYKETILKIGDSKVRNYFINLFETNVKRVIQTQIEKDIRSNIYSNKEGLTKLTEFFTKIKGYEYFDDIQKEEFIGELSGYISTSFETILKEYYEHYINKAGESNVIDDYKRKTFSEGGLREYLYGNPSTESKNLKMQLDNITTNINQLVDYMTGIANGQKITEDNSTTLVVGRIFFDKLDRDNDDPLKKNLSATKSLVTSNISLLGSGEPDNSAPLIMALNQQIANSINTFTGVPLIDITTIDESSDFDFDVLNYDMYLKGKTRQAKDLLAALLAIKRHMMICYKQHLNMFLQKQMGYTPTTKQSEIVDNLSGRATTSTSSSTRSSRPPRVYGDEFEKIKSNWQVIFESIDKICEKLTDKIKDVDPKTFDSASYKKAMELITLTEPTKAIAVATDAILENF